MAFLTATPAVNYAIAPIGTNATHKTRSSVGLIKAHNCNMRWFEDKYLGIRSPAAGLSSSIISDLKSKKKLCSSTNLQFRVCMTAVKVDTAVKKIPVSPLSLEDATEPPKETYTPDKPYEATVVSVTRIVGLKAPGETCHVVLNHDGNAPSWEGQNYGVIPPGSEPATERLRYFSIASSRYGDYFDGNTSSLCVRRRSEDGVAANFLCDRKPGDKVLITGPYGNPFGTDMYLPNPVDPKATFIMVATGTGVGPFRAQLRRLFLEDIPNVQFKGLAWLFHGVATFDSRLYNEEFNCYRYAYPDNFLYDWSLSREDQNLRGGKMYIQDRIAENAQEIFRLLDGGAIIYFSGLKGMMPGIEEALKNAAEASGQNWDKKLAQYKINGQWRVQVY